MNKQTNVSQAIKADFARRLDAITDPAHRARIESLRDNPCQPRPFWVVDRTSHSNGIIVLPNVLAGEIYAPHCIANITLDRPSANNPTLPPNAAALESCTCAAMTYKMLGTSIPTSVASETRTH